MTKAKLGKEDSYIGILGYKNAPIDRFAASEKLMSWQLRPVLHVTSNQLQKKIIHHTDLNKNEQLNKPQKIVLRSYSKTPSSIINRCRSKHSKDS